MCKLHKKKSHTRTKNDQKTIAFWKIVVPKCKHPLFSVPPCPGDGQSNWSEQTHCRSGVSSMCYVVSLLLFITRVVFLCILLPSTHFWPPSGPPPTRSVAQPLTALVRIRIPNLIHYFIYGE